MNNEIISGALVTPSLSLIKIQASLVTGAPIEYEENSTLNEHLEILRNEKPNPLDRPILNIMVFGRRGYVGEIAPDGEVETTLIVHDPLDAAPYKISPVALREVDNDFSNDERKRYCFRKSIVIKGVRYFAYYGIRLAAQTEPAESFKNRRIGGTDNIEPLVYTNSNLHPKPPKVADNSLNSVDRLSALSEDATLVYTHVIRDIRITVNDTVEYMNACNILYGNPQKADVSEILLCTSVDKEVQVEAGDGTNFFFNEAIGAQPGIYISTEHNLSIANEGINSTVRCGQTKPFKLRSV